MKYQKGRVTPMKSHTIESYLSPGARAHLVGIGGVSMRPLAEVLLGMGLVITGSDMQESPGVAHLRSLGIPVSIGHRAENLGEAQLLIRTAAAPDNNPEVAAARAQNVPVFERAQAWGQLMQSYRHAVCISGTHGKTSTTSMCTHIAMAARLDPTVMIGGTLPLLGSGHRVGQGDTIVLESCEYMDSFLSFSPTIAVILNVDLDHLDYFHDLAQVQRSFRTFAQQVPQDGCVVANCEDANTMEALDGLDRPMLTFGLTQGDVHTQNLVYVRGLASFDVVYRGEHFAHISLQVPGEHNVKNALAAITAAIAQGVTAEAITQGLEAFHGVGRRMEKTGVYRDALVYDDYAHHPSELATLFRTTKSMEPARVVCAFQPHTYSRTHALFDDFVTELRQADVLILAEIYAAREQNTQGISSQDLAKQIPGAHYCASLEEVTQLLAQLTQAGDLVVTAGAGDIYKAGEALVALS